MKAFFRIVVMGLVLIAVALVSALTAMSIAIHGGEVNVPDLAKLTPAEAERICLNNGLLTVVDGQFYSPSVQEGRIVSQSPTAGNASASRLSRASRTKFGPAANHRHQRGWTEQSRR